MNHKCYNCRFFTAYYSKGYCCFLRTAYGHCGKFNETKQKHHTCENWQIKHYQSFKSSYFLKELETALTQINGIQLILDELSNELAERKK